MNKKIKYFYYLDLLISNSYLLTYKKMSEINYKNKTTLYTIFNNFIYYYEMSISDINEKLIKYIEDTHKNNILVIVFVLLALFNIFEIISILLY